MSETRPDAATTAAPVRAGAALARFEAIDASFLEWARAWGAEQVQFPALIPSAILERAEYPQAFPHLLMSACACVEPERTPDELLGPANLAPTGWLLSPAVCYHAYPHWAGAVLAQPEALMARGRCFRREAEFAPGRRQIEFEMREIVLAGSADWIAARTQEARERVAGIARELGIEGTWEIAEDPFFLPTAKGKALMQRLQETKQEFVVRGDGIAALAIASVNRHGTFFGERFNIALAAGGPAHTACIAFGLDRWAACARAR